MAEDAQLDESVRRPPWIAQDRWGWWKVAKQVLERAQAKQRHLGGWRGIARDVLAKPLGPMTPCEQRHFYANKAKTEVAHFV